MERGTKKGNFSAMNEFLYEALNRDEMESLIAHKTEYEERR